MQTKTLKEFRHSHTHLYCLFIIFASFWWFDSGKKGLLGELKSVSNAPAHGLVRLTHGFFPVFVGRLIKWMKMSQLIVMERGN